MSNWKNRIVKFSSWAQRNWLAFVIILMMIMMLFLWIVMASWTYGFWANGLWGAHFDLSSCWQGITVVITGLGGVAALAKAAWTKYSTDSKYNSEAGQKPYEIVKTVLDDKK